MENHPIPQDVTGFQFKLIGNMTIKQFAYLAGGVISAWLVYLLPFPFFIKLPLIGLFTLAGCAFAFFPVEGRPLDLMVTNFLKAVFAPNQYLYQKVGGQLEVTALPITKASHTTTGITQTQKVDIQSYIQHLPSQPKNKLDEKELSFMNSLFSTAAAPQKTTHVPFPILQTAQAVPPPPVAKIISQKIINDKPIQPPNQQPNQQMFTTPSVVPPPPAAVPPAAISVQEPVQIPPPVENHQQFTDLQQQMDDMLLQKQKLEEQLMQLSQKAQTQPAQNVYQPSTPEQPKEESQNIRKVSKEMGAKVGLPITPEVANLVTGIIKDPRGNILPNILVEIKDTEGNPVRAFKTNALGQFASATPLLNGTYTMEFEDPGETHSFDAVELTANGEIIFPLEIISSDKREELRKELFG